MTHEQLEEAIKDNDMNKPVKPIGAQTTCGSPTNSTVTFH